MSIDPKYVTLDVLLHKRLFLIPKYQRAYSWQSQQGSGYYCGNKICPLA